MGNYLSHVAARALGQSPALQPRVPSLFEPPPALRSARLGPFPSLKTDPNTRVDAGDSLTAPSPQTRTRRRETRAVSTDDHSSGERGSDGDPAPRITGHKLRTPNAAEQAAAPADGNRYVQPAQEISVHPRPQIVPAAANAAPAPAGAREASLESDTRVTKPRGTAVAGIGSRLEKSFPRDPQIGVSEKRLPERPEERSAAAPERKEIPAHSQRPAPQSLAFPPAGTKDADNRDGGFSVSVVIERVNVQAVMPQPAPVRAARSSPAPMLSLEQYMKQRGELS
ncbi:MAG TPA: hypothetical protein VKF84_08310 [Candidatus Sulfotelmatobacter sp.]|nr:hypothetical protein [Candidatus Sulfotelmatobacter sp.]